MDLLRPEMRLLYQDRANSLRAEVGSFALVNSNFGWLNHALTPRVLGPSGDRVLLRLAKRSRHSESFLKFRLAVFRAFIEVLPRLSVAFPDRTIVVRPHPSEDPSCWAEAARGLENIQIRYDDQLVPWLLGADAIVHNGCTTAVEAALLGRRPIIYRPVDGGQFESAQPLSVSFEARTPEELINAVAYGAETESRDDEVGQNLGIMVNSLDGKLSAERIADTIVARADARQIEAPRLQRVKGWTNSMVRRLEKSAAALRDTAPSHPAYINHKFPPTPVAQIEERVRRIATLLNRPIPAVAEISGRIFEIRSAG